MSSHPKERWSPDDAVTRRAFLTRGGSAAAGLAGLGGLLGAPSYAAAREGAAAHPAGSGPGGIPLARPGHPVTLPIYSDNKPIPSKQRPEKGTLQVYNWDAYINQKIVDDFGRKHGVSVKVSTFSTMDEAMAKLLSRSVEFDVFVPTVDRLAQLVAAKLVQPLNLDYIPNLKRNVWPALTDPWYDRHSRYTVPYTVWTTGIAWRKDKLPKLKPYSMRNPYEAFWQAKSIAGKVALLDDQRDAIGMTLLKHGIRDVNSENPKYLTTARKDLLKLVDLVNLKFDTNDYQNVPDGQIWLHQAWSGDIVSTPAYMPKGTPASVIGYWWPKNGHGLIGSDTVAILKGARNPVLAHLFLNHLLDYQTVLENFSYTGYQQPLIRMKPQTLVAEKLIPPHLKTAVVLESQFKQGYQEATLTPKGQALWQDTWSQVKAGG